MKTPCGSTYFRPPSFIYIYSIVIVWKLITCCRCRPVAGFAVPYYSTASSSRRITRTIKNSSGGTRLWQQQQEARSFSSRVINALSSTRSSKSSNGPKPPGDILKHNDDDDDDVDKMNDRSSAMITKQVLNLSTVHKEELEAILVDGWGYPRYRADQVWNWIRVRGVTNAADMDNLPKKLRQQLAEFTKPSSLEVVVEQVSQKDGTVKRLYKCADGQMIESVLMGPYDDGRYTACISSQAGCAQGCVFCATGQMGFRRQLSSDEILEQVARFAAELQTKNNDNNKTTKQPPRLSNIVFMGMGEPLSNYINVRTAIHRIINELGIGARRITVSTVGIVPRIRQMWQDPEMPSGVRLAVSLHCASDEERDALLPANRRYGGLDALLASLQEYQEGTNRRITLEWALIAGINDSAETARKLGNLLTKRGQLRRDLLHINVIPLNPTGWNGRPSDRGSVNKFCQVLQDEFRIACTPRVRRGIDIDAGCGQLTTKALLEKEKVAEKVNAPPFSIGQVPQVGVYEDDEDGEEELEDEEDLNDMFAVDPNAIDFDSDDDDYEDPEFSTDFEKQEVARLIAMVQQGTLAATPPMIKDKKTSNNNPTAKLQVNLKSKKTRQDTTETQSI